MYFKNEAISSTLNKIQYVFNDSVPVPDSDNNRSLTSKRVGVNKISQLKNRVSNGDASRKAKCTFCVGEMHKC